jgi:hypothetical protein
MDDAAHTWRRSIDLGLPGGDCLRAGPSAPVMSVRASGGRRLPANGRRSERVSGFGRGRICTEPSCGTVLSMYNPSPYCSLHDSGGILSSLRRVTDEEDTALDTVPPSSRRGRRRPAGPAAAAEGTRP